MKFSQELNGYIRENGLTHTQVAERIGVGQSTISYWISGSPPNRKNKAKALEVIRGSAVEKKPRSIVDETLREVQRITTPDRFVRVSFPVQTLTDVLAKAEAYGEVVVEEEGQLYKVVKLGA